MGMFDVSEDPILEAMVDRIVYLMRKNVITRNEACWQLCDVLAMGKGSLNEKQILELWDTVDNLLDHKGRKGRRYKSDSRVIAARVPSYVMRRIDDFASAYRLTRSQCLGLALDLVYGQEWQLETEPWKGINHRAMGYASEALRDLWKLSERGFTKNRRRESRRSHVT